MKILAYFEDWSRRPGQTVRLAISSEFPKVHATLVRVLSGPGNPKSPKTEIEELPEMLSTFLDVGIQDIAVGSYADLPLTSPLPSEISGQIHFFSTVPDRDSPQTLLAIGEDDKKLLLEIVGGYVSLHGPEGIVNCVLPLLAKTWYSLIFSLSNDGIGLLDIRQVTGIRQGSARATSTGKVGGGQGSLIRVAASGVSDVGSAVDAFNGKIENPTLWPLALSAEEVSDLQTGGLTTPEALGAWDFSKNINTRELIDVTGNNPNGSLFGGAERAVTSHAWSGLVDDFQVTPEQYAAIQFHEDEMLDCNWSYSLEFQLPEDLPSGLYAVRLSADSYEDLFPLFVPSPRDESAEVLLLFSTNTYLAYANDRLAALDEILDQVMAHELVMPEDEKFLHEHEELGRSCYDVHSDGTPVRYSSRRRPIINVRPGYPSWLTGSYRHFPADLYYLEWINRSGHSYHIATDEEVENEGANLFGRYKVVVTSTHPEYWSLKGLDALQDYLTHGGRIMYLGGNGFYWVTSIDPERPWIIEIRRDNSGTRCWNAPFGERTHLFDGVPGGLWRMRGRGPNTLLGVGFASEGWNKAQPFVRSDASFFGPASVWFEGITNEILGAEGFILGGAAGDEFDRFDLALGSPPHAEVLATATGFANEYQLVIEDQEIAMPSQGGQDRPDLVRCDMVYLPIDGGGAVFSGSSMTYGGAMAWNNFDNGLAKITTRVLDSFCGELPE